MIHLLAERGLLNYDMRISDIWPEFAAKGKQAVTVRHVLQHTAGIPHMPDGIGLADVVDWHMMCRAVAELTPQWPPGEHMAYHAITYGWLLGELAQRVDGRSFAEILQQELCDPLGIKDMYVGMPDEAGPRVAILDEPDFEPPPSEESGPQAIPAWICPLHQWMNTPEARRACVPASNGIMTAKSLARHYAALLPGGIDGVQLLSDARIQTATVPLRLSDGRPLAQGLGYKLGEEGSLLGTSAAAFGHGGYGGSVGFADRERHLAVGLTKNLFSRNGAGASILRELKQKLDV